MERESSVPSKSESKKQDKKIKNLISAVILLVGLFVGSLFVDVTQLIKGSGFSEKRLKQAEVFESAGKTWVAYTEPTVNVKVLTDDTCEACDPAEILIWMRRVVPTVNAQKVDAKTEEGKAMAAKFGIKSIPAFVFSDTITKTDFYSQAQMLFDQKEGQYRLKGSELGLPTGKYLELPKINEGDAVFGNPEAQVKIAVFSDFQCPYCKLFYKSLRDTMKEYKDKVYFDYKHLPLNFHARANDSALASECALEQNKFWEYADKLYNDQAIWSKTEDNQKFKDYARQLSLNTAQFNQCLDEKKYQAKVDKDKAEAGDFGIGGTPAIFINDQFRSGVIEAADLKKAVDNQLNQAPAAQSGTNSPVTENQAVEVIPTENPSQPVQ